MVGLVRVARVVLLLILAVVALTLVMAIARPETGGMEKLVLAALLVCCLAVGGAVRSVAARLQHRAARHR